MESVKKLAIVGSNSKTRGDAPFDDPRYEIWVFNEAPMQAWMQGKRWDVLFQLHKPEVYQSATNWVAKDHWQWLQAQREKTIWMQDYDLDVPCSERYPLEAILRSIPGADMNWLQGPGSPWTAGRGWFDLSAAYALALALHLGYREIEIYGLDLESNTEYSYQLGCWRFWVGIALGMGAHLVVKCSSHDFGSGRMYGYDGEMQISKKHFSTRAKLLAEQFRSAEKALLRAKERAGQAILKRDYDALAGKLILEWQGAAQLAGVASGALAEAENYQGRTDMISRQEFERRAAQAQQDGEGLKAQMYATGGKTEYVFNVWRQTGRAEALEQLRGFLGAQMQYAFDAGARVGIYQENMGYLAQYDALMTAAGQYKNLTPRPPSRGGKGEQETTGG